MDRGEVPRRAQRSAFRIPVISFSLVMSPSTCSANINRLAARCSLINRHRSNTSPVACHSSFPSDSYDRHRGNKAMRISCRQLPRLAEPDDGVGGEHQALRNEDHYLVCQQRGRGPEPHGSAAAVQVERECGHIEQPQRGARLAHPAFHPLHYKSLCCRVLMRNDTLYEEAEKRSRRLGGVHAESQHVYTQAEYGVMLEGARRGSLCQHARAATGRPCAAGATESACQWSAYGATLAAAYRPLLCLGAHRTPCTLCQKYTLHVGDL